YAYRKDARERLSALCLGRRSAGTRVRGRGRVPRRKRATRVRSSGLLAAAGACAAEYGGCGSPPPRWRREERSGSARNTSRSSTLSQPFRYLSARFMTCPKRGKRLRRPPPRWAEDGRRTADMALATLARRTRT